MASMPQPEPPMPNSTTAADILAFWFQGDPKIWRTDPWFKGTSKNSPGPQPQSPIQKGNHPARLDSR